MGPWNYINKTWGHVGEPQKNSSSAQQVRGEEVATLS